MPEGLSLAVLVDVAIAITLIEGVGLALYRRWTRRGLAASAFGPNLLAGLALMLALRCAVHGQAWWWVAACLMLAGAAHVADIVARTRNHVRD